MSILDRAEKIFSTVFKKNCTYTITFVKFLGNIKSFQKI